MASAGLAAFVAILAASPVSPLALGRADAALNEPSVAVARYDRVARYNPLPWLREEAALRAALVRSTQLGELADAEKGLERLSREPLDGARRAAVLSSLALVRQRQDKPGAAARAWLYAYEADPTAIEAADRLMSAARARAAAGNPKGAEALWAKVGERFPDDASDAAVARGELRLASGDVEGALSMFAAARNHPGTAGQAARLGLLTCLERQGDLRGALVALDEADLPPQPRAQREEALRARLNLGSDAL